MLHCIVLYLHYTVLYLKRLASPALLLTQTRVLSHIPRNFVAGILTPFARNYPKVYSRLYTMKPQVQALRMDPQAFLTPKSCLKVSGL